MKKQFIKKHVLLFAGNNQTIWKNKVYLKLWLNSGINALF